jgi:phytoene dehydrogenase-like protein
MVMCFSMPAQNAIAQMVQDALRLRWRNLRALPPRRAAGEQDGAAGDSVVCARYEPQKIQRALMLSACSTTNLADVLTSNGFDTRAVRSLFLWEGVTYYLPESAVDSVLACVATLS